MPSRDDWPHAQKSSVGWYFSREYFLWFWQFLQYFLQIARFSSVSSTTGLLPDSNMVKIVCSDGL